MPITKIIIENFKGIRDRVEIPIRPLTLFFGANSAGKSTVLHALLYLRELLERQNADADRVIGGGNDVYLGGFRQLVHGHDEEKTVTVGVEYTVDADGLEPYLVAEHYKGQNNDSHIDPVKVDGVSGVITATVEVSVSISNLTNIPIITRYAVAINGRHLGEIAGGLEMKAILFNVDINHPIFDAQYSQENLSNEDADDGELNPISSALRKTLFSEIPLNSIIDGDMWVALGHAVIPKWGNALEFELDDDEWLSQLIMAPFSKFILSQLMVRPGELILEHLRTYRHLGPIRSVPNLSSIAQRSPSLDRWIDGMAAWDLLSVDAERQDSNRQQLIEKVNAYLCGEDRLNLGYSLSAETVRDIPADSALMKILERFVVSSDEFDGESSLRAAYAESLSIKTRAKLQLTDLRRNVQVNPSDIGAGVSQVIPVLVSALDTTSKITAIEQPELHLHPAVQCSLGDLFIREANKANERFFLIETHSEHLLLRLMRRIRETQDETSPARDLTLLPEAITILFVETYEGRSIYREMPLNERGDFDADWPNGFFGERFDEYE